MISSVKKKKKKPTYTGKYNLLRGTKDTPKKLRLVISNSRITQRKPVNLPRQIKLGVFIIIAQGN